MTDGYKCPHCRAIQEDLGQRLHELLRRSGIAPESVEQTFKCELCGLEYKAEATVKIEVTK